MQLHISEIQGENYFYLEDALANETLANLQAQISGRKVQGMPTIDFLDSAKQMLAECVGFRKAQAVSTFEDLERIVIEETEHRKPYNEFAQKFWAAAINSAKRVSKINPEEEIRRDAIFHTLRRTGYIQVYNIVSNSNLDELDVTNRILAGEKLSDVIQLPYDVVNLLTRAMLSSKEREKFLNDLIIMYSLTEEQAKQIDKALYKSDVFEKAYEQVKTLIGENQDAQQRIMVFFRSRERFDKKFEWLAKSCGNSLDSEQVAQLREILHKLHKGLGDSQPVKISTALEDLFAGKQEVSWVLDFNYRIAELWPLADLLSNTPLKRLAVEHVHTGKATTVAYLHSALLNGEGGTPTKVLAYLAGLTGLDPWPRITRHEVCGGEALLYPRNSLNEKFLGRLFGEMLSRGVFNGSHYNYTLRKPKGEVLDLMEQFGVLTSEPATVEDVSNSKELAGIFDKSVGYERSYVSTIMTIPKQIENVYTTILAKLNEFGRIFAVEALKTYAANKGHQKRQRWRMLVRQGHENIITDLAARAGAQLNRSEQEDKQVRYYINNPEAIGLAVT